MFLPRANPRRGTRMKLYSGPLSLFSRKVEIALYEKSLPFEREMVAFTQAAGYSPKHPDVLAANPKGQVPVLVDGDLTLFDSTLIFEYLEDAYPAPPLYPAGAKPRARCRLIELSADEILLPLVRSLMFRNAPPDPDAERQRLRESEGERAEAPVSAFYGGLQERLGGRGYCCGHYSVAEVAMFVTMRFFLRLHGPRFAGLHPPAAWCV